MIHLGSIQKDDQTWTNGPKESLEYLLQTHFPENSCNITVQPLETLDQEVIEAECNEIITKHKI